MMVVVLPRCGCERDHIHSLPPFPDSIFLLLPYKEKDDPMLLSGLFFSSPCFSCSEERFSFFFDVPSFSSK